MASALFRITRPVLWALLALPQLALAQDDPARPETVTWSASADAAAKSKAVVTLHGSVADGWHVYGLKQVADGPTPLEVQVDANAVAQVDGAVRASAPVTVFEPAFGAKTQIYAKPFTITVPLRLKPHLATGPHAVPVTVRFQTCNGRICQPPTSVHVSATVNVEAAP